jgi:3-hydroxybutyryl-CoA dehydratase
MWQRGMSLSAEPEVTWRVGERYTQQFTVSQAVYDGFREIFRDQNPLHTDDAYARAQGFAGRVMHGNILSGFVSYFVGEGLPTRAVIIHKQDLRFRRPTYLGDVLDFSAELVNHSEAVGALEFAFQFRNPTGDVVATGKVSVGLLHG